MFMMAIDIGYSNLKLLAGAPGRAPSAVVLPSGAGPLRTMPTRLAPDEHAATRGYSIVTVDGAEWAAGVEPSRLQNWERELHPDYPASSAYRALYYAALAGTGVDRVDRVVTGLPVTQYLNQARRDQLASVLGGIQQVTVNRRVTVQAVDILPQPVGAYLDLISDSAEARSIEQARLLVIDPGFFSVDWVVIDGGELRHANSGSSPIAMSMLFECADYLIQHEHGAGPGRDRIEQAVRAGVASVYLRGQAMPLTSYLDEATSRTAPVALTAVKQSLRGEKREVDMVLLAGGGAAAYADAARDAFPRARIITPTAPVLANVRGFWEYASAPYGASDDSQAVQASRARRRRILKRRSKEG